jgi:hypothetical protein
MLKTRWIEFFEGDGNRLSMARLTMFASFFPSSYVVVATKSETIFGWFVSAYVLGYVGGKGADILKGKRNARIPTAN